jgi:Yip1 domain
MKDFLKTINHVIFKPAHFYQHIEKRSIKDAFIYLMVFALITQLLIVYNYFQRNRNYLLSEFKIPIINIPFTWENFILLYVATVVWVIFFNLIRPALTHFFVRLYNKRALFRNTYKTIIYSNTPSYIVTPFYLTAVAMLFTMIFLKNVWFLVVFIISAAFWIGGDCYGIYLRLLGFKKLHHLSIFKSILCLYIFPMLFLLVLEIVVLALVFGIMILRLL